MATSDDKSLLDHLVSIATNMSDGPSSEDRFFVSTEDPWDNACLSFRLGSDGWSLYAIGYKEAADILVAHVEANVRQQDILVYPILFLYRQYLELALKNLIRQARRFLDIDEPLPTTHRIDGLWRVCSQLLAQIAPGDEEEQHQTGRLIEEFTRVDPKSEAFRYPEYKDGNPSLPGIDRINLRNVMEVISKIAAILDGAAALIFEYSTIY